MNPILLAAATLGDKIDSAFYAFDMWVFHLFGSMQCGFLTTISKIFTTFGDEAFVIPMAILGIVLSLQENKKIRLCTDFCNSNRNNRNQCCC